MGQIASWGHATKWDQKAISNWYFKPIDGKENIVYNGYEKSDGLIIKPVKCLDK
jgi:hypothetical protein